MMRCRSHLAAVAALLLSAGPALAGASVSFPFTGSNGTTYTGQTAPTDANGLPLAPASGIGPISAMVTPSANGTPIVCPTGSRGVRFYFPSGTGLSLAIAATQPTSAPPSVPLSQAGTGPNWDEDLSGQVAYVTAVTGAPLYRCR